MKKIITCLFVMTLIFVMPACAEDSKKPGTSYYVKYLVDTNSQITEFRMFNQAGQKLRIEKREVNQNGNASDSPSIIIYRADLMLSWEYNPQIGKMNETRLTAEDILGVFGQNPYQIAKKVGEEKVLGYECDIFDFNNGNLRDWFIKGTAILLKSINSDGSVKAEATEIIFGKQDDDLFKNLQLKSAIISAMMTFASFQC